MPTICDNVSRRGFIRLGISAAAALALSGIAPREARAFDQGFVTISHTNKNDGSPWYHYPSQWEATKNYGTDAQPLYCVNPDLPGSPVIQTYTKEPAERYLELHPRAGAVPWTHDELRGAAWYSWLAPGFDASIYPATDWNGDPMSASSYFVLSHIVLSDCITATGAIATAGADSSFVSWVNQNVLSRMYSQQDNTNSVQYKATANVLGTLPPQEVFDVFILNPEHGDGRQALIGWDYHPMGRISVTKHATGGEDPGASFGFRATIGSDVKEFTLKGGETWTSDLYAEGTSWSVSETSAPEGWRQDSLAPASGTIATGRTITVTADNSYHGGRVSITKRVWQSGDGDFAFDVSFRTPKGVSDVRHVTLHANSTWASGLYPAGTAFSVRETSMPSGWRLDRIEPASGTVGDGTTVDVTARDIHYGRSKLQKSTHVTW